MRRFFSMAAFGVVPLAALVLALSGPRVTPPGGAGTIRDLSGRVVPVVPPARRVVIFPPVASAYLTIDDTAEHVRAVSGYQADELRRGLLRHVFTGLARLPVAATIGRETAIPGDPEQLLALHADAVVSWSSFSDSLRDAGLPLVPLDLDLTEGTRGTKRLWRLLGAVAGRDARAEFLIERYTSERRAILSRIPRGRSSRPRALFVYQYGPSGLLVAYGGTDEDEWLAQSGASNVAARLLGPQLNVEQLLEYAPQVVVISNLALTGTLEAFRDDPALGNLPAVESHRIYLEPTGGARMEGLVEEPLLLEWLAEIMQPRAMPARFRQDLRSAYAAVYGIQLSDEAIDETLRMTENANASGYERFARSSAAPGGSFPVRNAARRSAGP